MGQGRVEVDLECRPPFNATSCCGTSTATTTRQATSSSYLYVLPDVLLLPHLLHYTALHYTTPHCCTAATSVRPSIRHSLPFPLAQLPPPLQVPNFWGDSRRRGAMQDKGTEIVGTAVLASQSLKSGMEHRAQRTCLLGAGENET